VGQTHYPHAGSESSAPSPHSVSAPSIPCRNCRSGQRVVYAALVIAGCAYRFRANLRRAARAGTIALVRLPPGNVALPIFDTELRRITARGSSVGTCQDLEEGWTFAGSRTVAALCS